MSGTDAAGGPRRVLVRKLLRYGTGSVVATVCSEATFLLLYGVLDTSTSVASVLGWLAGAGPNYWMNRSWTWGRRGRPSLRREVLPYAAVVLLTLVLAVTATGVANTVLRSTDVSGAVRSVLVGGVFLLVYVLVFILRFFLFDRLFATTAQGRPSGEPAPRPTQETT